MAREWVRELACGAESRRIKLCPRTSLIRPRHDARSDSFSVCGNCGYSCILLQLTAANPRANHGSPTVLHYAARHEVRTPLFVLSVDFSLCCGAENRSSSALARVYSHGAICYLGNDDPNTASWTCCVPLSRAAHDGMRAGVHETRSRLCSVTVTHDKQARHTPSDI